MTTSTLRRLASSLMLLTLCATVHVVRAQSPTSSPASASKPGTAATVAPAPLAAAADATSTAATSTAATSTAATSTDVPSDATAPDAEASEDGDWDGPNDEQGHRARHHHHRNHEHHGSDVVNIGHDSNLPVGQRGGSVVAIFGSSTSDGEADDVVSVFGDTRVTGHVRDGAVAVMGNNYIDSRIEGDAVAVLGNLELGPHADIGGDVVAVGGTLTRDPAAIVHGEVENILFRRIRRRERTAHLDSSLPPVRASVGPGAGSGLGLGAGIRFFGALPLSRAAVSGGSFSMRRDI